MSSCSKYESYKLAIHDDTSYYTLLALDPNVDVQTIMERITYLESYCFPGNCLDSFALKQFGDLDKIRNILYSEENRTLYNTVHKYAIYSINKRLTV